MARIVRIEIEDSKVSEISDLTKRMDEEKRALSQDGAMTTDQMRAHLKEREHALLQRIEAAKQEEAAAIAAAELADEEIKLGFQRRMMEGLTGEQGLAQSRAAQMEAATGMRELNLTIHELKAEVASLRNANARQSDKLLRMEAERKRGFVPEESSKNEGANAKAVVRQRREMAIQMEKGRRYCVEGSTDWVTRIEHLIRRFNVPESRADQLMQKYLGHAGLAASELEGVGGAVVVSTQAIRRLASCLCGVQMFSERLLVIAGRRPE